MSLTFKQRQVIKRHLTGDTKIPRGTPTEHARHLEAVLHTAAQAAKSLGEVWNVNDGYRPYADQVRLYALYKAGKGNLAAVPGTSNHGRGLALDISGPDGKPVGSNPRRARRLRKWGLCLPVPGELWHVEIGDKWVARKRP